MVIFKVRNMKLLIILAIVSEALSESLDNEPGRTSKGLYAKLVDNRNLFSPRMEYDEWTPLGRGDPLKNDPTYDYVPPVLERVHYWMEPSKRTPDPPVLNSGVLILGSSRTEPTFAVRATTAKYQVKEPHADSRLDTMSLLDPFLKLMDVSKFGINLNPSTNYYKPGTNQNRIHQVNYQRPVQQQQQQQYYNRYQQALQRPPYTMLMPPPPPPSTSSVATFATVTTTTEVTTTPGQTTAGAASTTITKSNQEANITTAYPTTVIANTENLYKPVAIDMPEDNEAIRNDADVSMESAEVGSTTQKYKLKYRTPSTTTLPKGERHPPKWGADNRATTTRPVTTTRVTNTLTTDPMFKHYKQPSEPIKGPFYLIIQGHSKVKTYGASKNPINGLLTSNEIREDGDTREKTRKRVKSLSRSRNPDDERRKRFDEANVPSPVVSELSAFGHVNLEDAFGKTEGGSSKKRYLENYMMNETFDDADVQTFKNRQLLSDDDNEEMRTVPAMITISRSTTTAATDDNYNIESFIALNDDYEPEDVVSLLLKEEGQGSGFGNFVVSILGKSVKEER